MSCTPSVSAPVLFDCENAHLRALHAQTHQGISADLVASIEGFSREDLDSFAWNSQQRAAASIAAGAFAGSVVRSEEHTSELQSLMRISYAVFCLKKKNKIKI